MLVRSYCYALISVIVASAVQAVKDSAWHNGVETPNVDLPMYWGDMPNVLEDLGNFSKLYVQYHSCAWNQYGGFGDQENTGRDVEENDYWYMGSMNSGNGWSYAPQISFSLYGVLKGSMRKGCKKRTYINSFYTTSGFYAFSNEIANAGIVNNGNEFSMSCQNGVGLTCGSSGHGFSFTRYSDKYCTRGNETSEGVPEDLAYFNEVLSDAQCVEIYDANSGSIPSLLYHSRSCELRDDAGACPDPYGRKTLYEKRMLRVLAGMAPDDEKYHRKMVKGYTYLGFGALFVAGAAVLAIYEKLFGPRRMLKTKSKDEEKGDVEAPRGTGKRIKRKLKPGNVLKRSRSADWRIASRGSSKDAQDDDIQESDVPEIYSLKALGPTSLEQSIAAQAMQEDGMVCGVKPTLEAVLDQVEEAVANTNIECTSEQNVMACVSMDADDLLVEADPLTVSPSLSNDLSKAPEEPRQKRKSFTLPNIQTALSMNSKGSTREVSEQTGDAYQTKSSDERTIESNSVTSDRIPETLPLSKVDDVGKSPRLPKGPSTLPVNQANDSTLPVNHANDTNLSPRSPRASAALKKFKKFWK